MKKLLLLLTLALINTSSKACSVLYYIDKHTGKIYVANHEDYWYNVKPFIRIEPAKKDALARLWYGWDKFAQGGINEAGLFFDGAVSPDQPKLKGHKNPKGNFGDGLLANCRTVNEAIQYIKDKQLILHNAHMMLGDSTGNAVVLEWINNKLQVIPIQDNKLIMTNYLLSDTTQGNYPCPRYNSIAERIAQAEQKGDTVSFLQAANFIGGAAQPERAIENGKTGGTRYSTFINISDMQLVVMSKLDNSKIIKVDIKQQFATGERQKIELE